MELDSYDRLLEGDSNNGPVVVPFDPDNSLLYKVVLPMPVVVPNEPICCQMPKNADPLSLEQITVIYDWINEGAVEVSLNAVNYILDHYEVNLETYPNPFNNHLIISLSGITYGQNEIVIYDLAGKKIKAFKLNTIKNNKVSFIWDGINQIGEPMPSGVYIVSFSDLSQVFSFQKKVLFLK